MPKSRLIFASGTLGLLILAACGGDGVSDPNDGTESAAMLTSSAAQLALACGGCHGPQSGAIVSLVDYPADLMAERFLDYKNDPTGTTVMHRLARGYSEDDIAQISAYLGDLVQP